jgi:hypothetical protein
MTTWFPHELDCRRWQNETRCVHLEDKTTKDRGCRWHSPRRLWPPDTKMKIKCLSATTLKLKHENLRNFVALGAWLELNTKYNQKNSKTWNNHRYLCIYNIEIYNRKNLKTWNIHRYLCMYNIEIYGNNEHLRAMMTMWLRTRPVAHGGLSPPSTMAADTQRTATHSTKVITKRKQHKRFQCKHQDFIWNHQQCLHCSGWKLPVSKTQVFLRFLVIFITLLTFTAILIPYDQYIIFFVF